MRRSPKQDLLLAVCSKMSEVIPFLTDEECDACINFLKGVHASATQNVESVASPAFQNLSLRELFTEKVIGEVEVGPRKEKEKKVLTKPKPSLSPRAPSKGRPRKRALWSEEDGGKDDDSDAEFESPVKKTIKPTKAIQNKDKPKKEKKAEKGERGQMEKVDGPIVKWDPGKHGVIDRVVSFDNEQDAVIVEAKVSTHFRAKANRAYITAKDVDNVKEVYWPKMASYFMDHEIPASFEATRFAIFCANKK